MSDKALPNRFLPTKPFAGMQIADLLLLELPHFKEEDRWYFLWEETGYPCFFAGSEWPVHILQRQLREFRDA